MKSIYIIIILMSAVSCSPKNAVQDSQGLTGKVVWSSGNHMPSPNYTPPAPQPIQREVMIYELTSLSQTEGEVPIYRKVNSKLVKKVMTDSKGQFSTSLPMGQYSIFIKEENGLFASLFSSNSINPVTIEKGEMTEITINVNYEASY